MNSVLAENTSVVEASSTHLPSYDNAYLASLSPSELIDLMRRDEDRVPRNVIDECARRGDAMLDAFSPLLDDDEKYWSDSTTDGDWWLHTHALHTLGLMDTERAGLSLYRYLVMMDTFDDDNLMEWHAGHWPALFENKPAALDEPLLRFVLSDKHNGFQRMEAFNAAVTRAQRQGPEVLEAVLDQGARLCANENEDWDARLALGNTLLDFPRQRHRALLEKLVREQPDEIPFFDMDSVRTAFTSLVHDKLNNARNDIWKFYEPAEIAKRQKRWQEEDSQVGNDRDDGYFTGGYTTPYRREQPKVGRNDPCPCGSGKKYKKCCLDKAA